MDAFFEFEKPIVSLEKKLKDLKELSKQGGVDLTEEIAALERKVDKLIDEVFHKLSRWEKVQLSRHPNRPYTLDYIENLFPNFIMSSITTPPLRLEEMVGFVNFVF